VSLLVHDNGWSLGRHGGPGYNRSGGSKGLKEAYLDNKMRKEQGNQPYVNCIRNGFNLERPTGEADKAGGGAQVSGGSDYLSARQHHVPRMY
jgi:hypothetical protein